MVAAFGNGYLVAVCQIFVGFPLMHDMTIFGETLISVSRDYDVTQNQGNETLT